MKARATQTLSRAAFVVALCHSATGFALDFRNTFENSMAFGKLDEKNDSVSSVKFSNAITSELTVPIFGGWQLFTRWRLESDTRDLIEPNRPQDKSVRSNASRRWHLNDYTSIGLREFYIDGYISLGGSDNSFIRIGKQQVVWGQADGFRVLDAINPMNLREFILEDNDDRRIPTWMVNAELPAGNWWGSDWTAQVLWIPDTTYHQTPSLRDEARFAPKSPRFVPVPNANTPGNPQSAQIIDADKPNRIISDSDFGVRLNAFVNSWDISINYLYHTLDRAAPYQPIENSAFIIEPQYERSHLLGTTFSSVFDNFTFRGEVALHSARYYIAKDFSEFSEGVAESPSVDTVFGLDFNGFSDTFISGQLFLSHITDFDDAITRDRTDTTVSLLIERDFYNQTLTLGGQWFYNANDGDGLLRFSAEYRWRSNIIVTAGLDSFYGKERGLFGQFNQQDQITLGFTVGF
ncbi:DUF1302 family protein [Aurantivibrio plasticivorans]